MLRNQQARVLVLVAESNSSYLPTLGRGTYLSAAAQENKIDLEVYRSSGEAKKSPRVLSKGTAFLPSFLSFRPPSYVAILVYIDPSVTIIYLTILFSFSFVHACILHPVVAFFLRLLHTYIFYFGYLKYGKM